MATRPPEKEARGFDDNAEIGAIDWGICTARNALLNVAFLLLLCGSARLCVVLFSEELLKKAKDSDFFGQLSNYTMIIDAFSFLVIITCNSRGISLCFFFLMIYRGVRCFLSVLSEYSSDWRFHSPTFSVNIVSMGIYLVSAAMFCLIAWRPCRNRGASSEKSQGEDGEEKKPTNPS